MAELDAEHRGLQGVQAAVGAEHVVVIFFLAAVHPQGAETFRERGIFRSDEATIPGAAQIFRWKETETSELADGSNVAIFILCADRLRGVFDYRQIAGSGQRENRI